MYDIELIRKDFPILDRQVYGKPLVYLDNGATTQKPRMVVDAITEEYYSVNANVHRGVHYLSQEATKLHEASRERVRAFIGAASTNEIIFTRGTTEAINLLASSFGEAFLHEGDEVIVSAMENHSNIVPWQLLETRKGIKLRVIPITDKGEICMDEYVKLFNEHTRLVSVMHVSNVLGTVNPIKEMIRIAHEHDVPFAVDGAQSVPHIKVDVQELDADFYAFSAHKVYGPTGIGVLYGKERWLDRMPPYQGGGEMIQTVSFGHTTFNELPYKFEAGTPDYIGTTISVLLPSCTPSTTCRRSVWTTLPLTKSRSPTMPCSACARFPGCASSARPRSAEPLSPSTWATYTHQTWAPCSTASA